MYGRLVQRSGSSESSIGDYRTLTAASSVTQPGSRRHRVICWLVRQVIAVGLVHQPSSSALGEAGFSG